MTTPEMVNEEYSFQKLKEAIKRSLNFESDKYTDAFIKRRIGVRMRATGINNYGDYEEFLMSNHGEKEELNKNLTIHVTEFFRDAGFWQECRNRFFKDVIAIFSDKPSINIWSAGCSSGQEAVSILITFLEINKNLDKKIKIVCTDISEEILKKAEKFEYESFFETRGLTPEITDKYFVKEKDKLRLKDEYRSNFRFLKHDILKEKFIEGIDVIFLRNTVIYFSKETKDALYDKIYEHLDEKGFFILGKTETLTGDARNKFRIYDSKERIFQKL